MLHCCDLGSQRNSNTDPSPQLHACRSQVFCKKQKSTTARLPVTNFLQKSKKNQQRVRGSRVTGDGALLRRGIPEHNKKQSCGVTRACPLLRATCKFPYSIKENNVTETRPLLHVTQAPPLRRFAIDSRA